MTYIIKLLKLDYVYNPSIEKHTWNYVLPLLYFVRRHSQLRYFWLKIDVILWRNAIIYYFDKYTYITYLQETFTNNFNYHVLLKECLNLYQQIIITILRIAYIIFLCICFSNSRVCVLIYSYPNISYFLKSIKFVLRAKLLCIRSNAAVVLYCRR